MVKRNIIILLPPPVAKRAIAWSNLISNKYKTDFVLDGKQFHPHVTLYQGEYPDENMPILEEKLAHIVQSAAPFCIRAKAFSSFEEFLFVEIEKDDELVSFQKTIFIAAMTLGKSLSPVAGATFLPHVTITRLQQPNRAEEVLSLLGATDIAFEAHALSLANIGPDGTVNEVYREFPFQMV